MKNKYYVAVTYADSNNNPVCRFVTCLTPRLARWDPNTQAMWMDKSLAEYVAEGLRWNGYQASVLSAPAGAQIYNY